MKPIIFPSRESYSTEKEFLCAFQDCKKNQKNSIRLKKIEKWKQLGGNPSEIEGKSPIEIDIMISDKAARYLKEE